MVGCLLSELGAIVEPHVKPVAGTQDMIRGDKGKRDARHHLTEHGVEFRLIVLGQSAQAPPADSAE